MDLNQSIESLVKSEVFIRLVSSTYGKISRYITNKAHLEETISTYLETTLRKYSVTKSLIFNKQPTNILDFYVDVDLKYGERTIENVNFDKVNKLTHSLIITGVAGSGKTTVLKYLFLDALYSLEGFPVFVELRKISESNYSCFEDFLLKNLNDLNLDIEIGTLQSILKTENCTIFLDGFDEINHDKRKKVARDISKFNEKYRNKIIVSSRPSDFISWHNFSELNMLPFSREKAILFVKKSIRSISEKKIDVLIKELNDNLFIKNEFFLSNPLLLSILLITYSSSSEIPAETHLFYERALDELYSRHDWNKEWYKRKRHSSLKKKEFYSSIYGMAFFSYLDEKDYFKSEKDSISYIDDSKEHFNIKGVSSRKIFKDMLESCSIIVREGDEYKFIHKSFQEYFSAKFIEGLDHNEKLDVIKELSLPYDEKLVDFLFEIDLHFMVENFANEALTKIKNATSYDKKKPQNGFRKYLELYHPEILLEEGIIALGYYRDSLGYYNEYIYNKYQYIFSERFKDFRALADYDVIDNSIKRLTTIYESDSDNVEKYNIEFQAKKNINEEYGNSTADLSESDNMGVFSLETKLFEIKRILASDLAFNELLKILSVEYNQYKTLMESEEKLLKRVINENENKRVRLKEKIKRRKK